MNSIREQKKNLGLILMKLIHQQKKRNKGTLAMVSYKIL